MDLDDIFEHFAQVYNANKNNLEELTSLNWLANIIGSEECKNDIRSELDAERKKLLIYFEEFADYYKKSKNCLIGYASKLNLQEDVNLREKTKILLKK